MDEAQFIRTISERTGLDEQQANDITSAALRALGLRLPAAQADQLAGELPGHQATQLRDTGGSPEEEFDVDGLVDRVLDLTGLDLDRETAKQHTASVLRTVRDASQNERFSDAMSHLPEGITDLLR